jgi:hypothetical protein
MVRDLTVDNFLEFRHSITEDLQETTQAIITTDIVIQLLNIVADLLLEMKEQKI